MRYAVSFAGNPAKRNISEPQIAPTFNLNLPGPWYLTFYPSYDIRIITAIPFPGRRAPVWPPTSPSAMR